MAKHIEDQRFIAIVVCLCLLMRGRPPASLAFGIALCSGYNALQIAGYKYDSPVIRSNPNCPPHHDKHPPIVTPINNGNNGERRMLVDRTSAKSRANAQNILGQGLSLRRSLLSRGGGEKKRGGVFGILQRGAKMLDSTLLNNEVKLAPAPVESKRKSKEALQRAIVSNMLLWAAVVGFTLAFQRWPSSLLLPSATSVEQQASAKGEGHGLHYSHSTFVDCTTSWKGNRIRCMMIQYK